jgi:hypothetical protein
MKDIFLKIAGVTSEKEFYSLYPDEQSFMKKHGKQFKKAQAGMSLSSLINPSTAFVDTNGLVQSGQIPGTAGDVISMSDTNRLFGESYTPSFGGNKQSVNWAQGIPIAGEIVKGVQMLKEEKKQLQKAKQWEGVTDVMAKAASMKGQPIERKYLRPEDNINTGEEFFPIYGVGTNPLAKNGTVIAQDGISAALSAFDNAGGTQSLNSILTYLGGGESGGSTIGGTVGGTAGQLIGNVIAPGVGGQVGKMVGQLTGTGIGNLLDTRPEKTKKARQNMDRNLIQTAFSNMPSNAYMRTGGNVGQNSMGNLQVYEGEAEPLSYNPYNGKTVMFRGPSHAKGGMYIKYGKKGLKVEGGEPATETLNNELVVFGDLSIPKELHPEANGKKFKHYVADISKKEEKQTNILNNAIENIGGLQISSPMDRLAYNTNKAMMEGANMKLKKFAEEKQKLASLQQAINDTAEEMGMNANSLSKGKLKAKDGIWLEYTPQEKAEEIFRGENYDKLWAPKRDAAFANPETARKIISSLENYTGRGADDVKALMAREKTFEGKMAKAKQLASDRKIGPYHSVLNNIINDVSPSLAPMVPASSKGYPAARQLDLSTMKREAAPIAPPAPKTFDWNNVLTAASTLMPYLRPSDAEELDPRQLSGEMLALADHVEPVQAQLYHPQLGVPYDISLQDVLNENRATGKAAQKLIGYNPAAQSTIAGQEYAANERVLGEQFRLNQAMRDKVYGENRNTLNQAQLTNLGILNNQYERQETAKSTTKANIQTALNSISSKYLQNQLENRTLQTYENLYNYRFDPNFRAINYNPPATFNMYGEYDQPLTNLPSDREVIYRKNTQGEYEPYDIMKTTKKTKGKNGDILKLFKNS